MEKNDKISTMVVRRLPRYYRFLQDMKDNGVKRVSSREFAEKMGASASQIRQDLNYFGCFGQQGYGYDVETLFEALRSVMGLDSSYRAVLLGAGNLGRAVINHVSFEELGFRLLRAFDKNPDLIGTEINGVSVFDVAELGQYCSENKIDAAILCLPKDSVESPAEILYNNGVRYFWNFSHFDLTLKYDDVIMENVHMKDSLMALCYRITEDLSSRGRRTDAANPPTD